MLYINTYGIFYKKCHFRTLLKVNMSVGHCPTQSKICNT